ncbi:MAG TPA: J domain-containing protein [Candidatus Bathyarchaeia archaeon]|nr:J domain-containing protein [Candidatus Bathyarchaeia archaeon]
MKNLVKLVVIFVCIAQCFPVYTMSFLGRIGKMMSSSRSHVKPQGQRHFSNNSNDSNDPYKILGVSRNATLQEIKRAYLELVKKYHPDLVTDPYEKLKNTETLKKINNAKEKLDAQFRNNSQNTNKKEEYNRKKEEGKRTSPGWKQSDWEQWQKEEQWRQQKQREQEQREQEQRKQEEWDEYIEKIRRNREKQKVKANRRKFLWTAIWGVILYGVYSSYKKKKNETVAKKAAAEEEKKRQQQQKNILYALGVGGAVVVAGVAAWFGGKS